MPKAISTQEHRWLNSDAQILGRVQQTADKNGHFCAIIMPTGEEFKVQVEKWDAATAMQFCEIARNTYHARKEEQEAQQASKAALQRTEHENLTSCEVTEAAPEETVKVDFGDVFAVIARIDWITDRRATIAAEENRLRVEQTKLGKIKEILDEPENDAEELRSVHTEMPPRTGVQGGMDKESRPSLLLSGGEEDDSGDDPEQSGDLDSLPDGEPESS